MALTVANTSGGAELPKGVPGDLQYRVVDITFDSSYPTNGESLTPADVSLSKIWWVEFDGDGASGYKFEYDRSAEKVVVRGPSGTDIDVTDDDSADSNGTAVYVHVADTLLEEGTKIGHLESVTAGDADSHFALTNGGPVVPVLDDDAASTGGNQLYFDENATNLDERFLADLDLAGDVDAYIMTSDGSFIRIKDDDSASSNGVAVYFDDDGANDYARLLFISPTDTDGAARTDDSVGLKKDATSEIQSGTDLSSVTVRAILFGES